MLDTDTKRRIDTARDILVGKVPDPKSQVEQITIALIYKFMDDMDLEAEELGGSRKFFADDYARYGWARLMRSGLGGHEILNLYAEAIAKMPENPGIPPLFRDIFKNAFLPYRDPETLRAFLKIIDEFEYDHSERLGDAFEYLLSVLGSQGDAGQFRTPRHIIDFIVEIVDPKKTDTVLDPACGTAGFLISAYKHILRANSTPEEVGTKPVDANGKAALDSSHIPPASGDLLTPDERGRLAANFKGYDISPDMVRLSLVNLYLHGFTDPHIYEYDTLTSQDRWNEYADVILANPPFMSPKGGIRPHNRFSVQSKRSEVLFLDYMAEHLTPGGRAGIIVPEGIIFQSQTAYRQLRRMLVEDYLVAVVSLPAGVFNPYSGVKTSILILDKALARQTDHIAFIKIENDGFNLGAQRRPIDKNDLPQARAEIAEYLRLLRAREPVEAFQPTLGLVVPKEKIAENDDYNLSGERYRENGLRQSTFPLRRFEEVCTLEYGASLPKEKRVDGPYPVVGSNGITGYHTECLVEGPAIVVGRKGSAGEVTWIEQNCFPIDTTYYVRQTNPLETDLRYLFRLLKTLNLPELRAGAGIPGLNRTDVYETHKLPLPPLEVQKEIVAQIEGYQKVIDGARAVLDNYRPHIPIHPDWPMVAIGDLCTIERGASPRPIHAFITDAPDGVNWVKIGDAEVGGKFITKTKERVTQAGAAKSRRVKPGDFVLSNSMSFGRPYIMAIDGCIHDGWLLLRDHSDSVDKDFLYHVLGSAIVFAQFEQAATGGVVNNLNSEIVRKVKIPLPPLEAQRAIVAEIEAEQMLVNANRELIARMEKKIQATLARVWGEDEAGVVEV
jgi:type I restriction enzyme M protein